MVSISGDLVCGLGAGESTAGSMSTVTESEDDCPLAELQKPNEVSQKRPHHVTIPKRVLSVFINAKPLNLQNRLCPVS